MNAQRFTHPRRGGWSYIQIVSYMIAIAAGVWLGAYYIGVPVEEIAYTALDKSTLLEQIPPEHRPETPAGLVQDPEQLRKQAEKTAAELQAELADLQREVAELQSGELSANVTKVESQDSKIAQRTLEYWNALRKITLQVGKLNAKADQSLDTLTASRVLEIRSRAFQYGAKAVEALDATDVDPQAYELGQLLVSWYGNGANLYDKTRLVWEGQQQGKTGLNESTGLATIQEQFTQESALLADRLAETNQRLTRRYGLEFQPLQ